MAAAISRGLGRARLPRRHPGRRLSMPCRSIRLVTQASRSARGVLPFMGQSARRWSASAMART
eukprot:scaffold1928_cov103-Isochrysis_galbana.AAC.3